MKSKFDEQIAAFNTMYGLPAPARPTMPPTRAEAVQKLLDFSHILAEELDEVKDIITKLTDGVTSQPDVLAEIADWLGDIQVYCASEMAKYGLESGVVLDTIMASNMSKLGEDGKPIYDGRGKVMKGPNYWKPEPQIKRYIMAAARQTPGGEQDAN